jgi:hypothetical protein
MLSSILNIFFSSLLLEASFIPVLDPPRIIYDEKSPFWFGDFFK